MSGYLAIDFGGTQTRAAWYDDDMAQLHKVKTLSQVDQPQADVLARLIELAQSIVPTGERPRAIGMAAPGPLDAAEGLILQAATLPGWKRVPIRQIISEAFDNTPTFIANDANLGAIAEAAVGAARGTDPVIYLTLSTGIGGGVLIDGKLFTGCAGMASEPGHQLMTTPDGSVLKLEELASGTALGVRAAARLAAAPDVETTLRGRPALTGKDVGEAALAGDTFAQKCVREAVGWLGLGIVNLIHLFNPEAIVLGGSLTRLGDLLWEPLQEIVRAHVIAPRFLPDDLLREAALGDDVCLVGAAYHARASLNR